MSSIPMLRNPSINSLTTEISPVFMKCFSLKQPYVDLIVFGEKIIELRKRNTKFRGEFLFHASKIWIYLFVRNGYR